MNGRYRLRTHFVLTKARRRVVRLGRAACRISYKPSRPYVFFYFQMAEWNDLVRFQSASLWPKPPLLRFVMDAKICWTARPISVKIWLGLRLGLRLVLGGC